MKKMFLMALGLAVCASVAFAGVGINWTTAVGMVQPGVDPTVFPGPGQSLLDSYSAIWQLIYAGVDNAIDPIDGSAAAMDEAAWAANNYLRPGGDDELIAQRTIALGGGTSPEDSTSWGSFMNNTGGDTTYRLLADGGQNWWDGGYVYQRIFQCDTLVTEGDPGMHGSAWFYETPVSDLLTIDTSFTGGLSTPQSLRVGTELTFGVPTYQVSVIPEPATMSLLGVGALVMAIRRRRS